MSSQRKYRGIRVDTTENCFLFRYKRPVPLEHFLYTGNSTSTNKELFMIIDADQRFLERKSVTSMSEVDKRTLFFRYSHVQAVAAKTPKQKDRQQNFGSKTRYDNLNTNQVYFSRAFPRQRTPANACLLLFRRTKLYGRRPFTCYAISSCYRSFVSSSLGNVAMIIWS